MITTAAILLILGLGVFFYFYFTPEIYDYSIAVSLTPTAGSVSTIPFSYIITAIDETYIYLKGTNGDLRIPNDANRVNVYEGTKSSHVDAAISDLGVGSTVLVDINPGVKAWLYIIK